MPDFQQVSIVANPIAAAERAETAQMLRQSLESPAWRERDP